MALGGVNDAVTLNPSGEATITSLLKGILSAQTGTGGGLGPNVQGVVDDGIAVTGVKPLLLGASLLSGATNKAVRTHPFSDDGNSNATNAMIVQAYLRVLNSSGSLDRLRGANAASGTTGTGVLGAGNLVYNSTLGMWTVAKGDNTAQFIHGPVAEGISLAGVNPLPLGAANSGVIRPLTAFSQSADAITLASAFGLEVNAVSRLVNLAGTSDRMRSVQAASGSTGLGVLGAGVVGLVQSGTQEVGFFSPLGLHRESSINFANVRGFTGGNVAADAVTHVSNPLLPGGGTYPLGTAGFLFNGSTWDRKRGNTEGTAVSGGAYTTTAVGADITNHNARGVLLHMDLTAAGGVSGVTIAIQAKDPASNKYQTIFVDSSARTATGSYRYLVYPGASASLGSYNATSAGAVPRTWRVIVTNTDGSSYTFSVGYQLIV